MVQISQHPSSNFHHPTYRLREPGYLKDSETHDAERDKDFGLRALALGGRAGFNGVRPNAFGVDVVVPHSAVWERQLAALDVAVHLREGNTVGVWIGRRVGLREARVDVDISTKKQNPPVPMNAKRLPAEWTYIYDMSLLRACFEASHNMSRREKYRIGSAK